MYLVFCSANFRSELWNLPENCAIPWQEMFADDNENEENKKDSIPDDDMDRLLLEVDDEPLDEIGKEIVEQNEKKSTFNFFLFLDSLLLEINEDLLENNSNAENKDENLLDDEQDDFFREICDDLP